MLLLVVDRRRRLAPGQLLGLYVAGYPIGRVIVEKMRTDEAELILGQRLNVWTSIAVFLLGLWVYWYTGRRSRRAASPPGPGEEPPTDAEVVADDARTDPARSQDVG